MAGDIIKSVTKTIVTDTDAYESGDFVGTAILTLEDVAFADQIMLHSVVLTDKSKQSVAIDFCFFSTVCSSTTFTNNAALAVHAADLLTGLGHASITASQYAAFSANSMATAANIGLPMSTATNSRNIYCAPVIRGAGTFAASALQATFNFIRP